MANKVDCICNVLEEIDEFYSIREFEKFLKYLNNLISENYLKEIQVKGCFAGFEEHWYKCNKCQQVWRLIYPDYPFKGTFDKI